MRTIIHDLNEKEVKKLKLCETDKIINALDCNMHCIGCFSCWVKHPKSCAIKDEFSNIADYIGKSDELVLISKSRYGCYSSETKMVLERCIGYVLPYFTIRNKEIHHQGRYDKKIKFSAYFYGDISKEDEVCLEKLVKSNAVNLNAEEYQIYLCKDLKELEKCIH